LHWQVCTILFALMIQMTLLGDGPGTGGPHNPMFTLHEADGDEYYEFLEEELASLFQQ